MAELEEAVAQLDSWIDDALPAARGGYPADPGALTTLAYYFRLRGIAQYLLSMDEAYLVHALHAAGRARLHYLEGVAAGLTRAERYATAARNVSFFDALAVHDLETARRLAQLCDERWDREREYEDDFLWMQFLQTALVAPEREAAVLERLSAAADPDSPFLALCVALHRKDAGELERHLAGVLAVRAANFAAMRDQQDLPVAVLATEPYLDVQGLAVVRLAALRGVAFDRELPSIPGPLVHMPAGRHALPSPDAWRGPLPESRP